MQRGVSPDKKIAVSYSSPRYRPLMPMHREERRRKKKSFYRHLNIFKFNLYEFNVCTSIV